MRPHFWRRPVIISVKKSAVKLVKKFGLLKLVHFLRRKKYRLCNMRLKALLLPGEIIRVVFPCPKVKTHIPGGNAG